ncbi:MAG: hypothetical protein KJZ86_12665 [Caldilineaceae bacterium]|nr:hypothetical protein [Caldilineaceae bacterium]
MTNARHAEFVTGGGYGRADFWPEAIAAERWREGLFKGLFKGIFDSTGRNRPLDVGLPFTYGGKHGKNRIFLDFIRENQLFPRHPRSISSLSDRLLEWRRVGWGGSTDTF